MASTYGILDTTTANKLVPYDLTSTDLNGARIYSDDWIDDRITDGELLVFGFLNNTYTLTLIPNDVFQAIRSMTKLYIKNQLIEDGHSKGQFYEEVSYFMTYISPTLLNRVKKDKQLTDAETIDDYEFTTI